MDTTRRNLIGGALALPAITIAAAAPAIAAVSIDRTAWDAAFAVMLDAKRRDDRINPLFDAAWDAVAVDDPADPNFSGFGLRFGLSPRQYLLTADIDAEERRDFAELGRMWWAPEKGQERRRQLYASVRQWRAERDAVRIRHNIEALEAEWEAAGEALLDAYDVLFDLPAPDLDALTWKLEWIEAMDNACLERVQQVLADVRRLNGSAAA